MKTKNYGDFDSSDLVNHQLEIRFLSPAQHHISCGQPALQRFIVIDADG